MAAPPSILFIFNSLAKFSQLAFFFFKMAKKTFGFLEAKCQEFLFLFNLQIYLFRSSMGSQKSEGQCFNIFYIHIMFIAKFGSTVFMD